MKGINSLIVVFALLLGFSFSAVGQIDVIEYDLDYSDPASDVTWVFGNGSKVMMSEPKDVNIKWVRSEVQGMNETLKLTIELSSPGQIRTNNVTVYNINIYTTIDNASHFVVSYTNGTSTLGTNTTSVLVNDSVQYSISDQEIYFIVNVSDLGSINYYNIDASAETREYQNDTVGWVLKKDFGWEVSGNPGTIPDDVPDDGGTPGFELFTMAVATGFALCVMTFRRR
jgi:hypothetical protein